MSADVLREAAVAIRKSVELAASQPVTKADVRGVWLNARYHLVMPTPAALAMADWLDETAEHFNPHSAIWGTATTFARAYLGDPA